MARKPVHLQMVGGKGPRQRVWEMIRQIRVFTIQGLRGELPGNIDPTTQRTYVASLERGGYLQPVDGDSECIQYKLVKDCGIEAPRLRKDGTPVEQGLGNEAMWGAMEALGSFTVRVLAAMAGVQPSTAKTYCLFLRRAGYLTVQRESRSGVQATYRLLRSKVTGPRPPMITRLKTVYDPNTGRIVWQQDPQDALGE